MVLQLYKLLREFPFSPQPYEDITLQSWSGLFGRGCWMKILRCNKPAPALCWGAKEQEGCGGRSWACKLHTHLLKSWPWGALWEHTPTLPLNMFPYNIACMRTNPSHLLFFIFFCCREKPGHHCWFNSAFILWTLKYFSHDFKKFCLPP